MTVERAAQGPWFEDLDLGDVFDDAPAVTLTSGHAAVHQAVVGDRLHLPLDDELSAAVTGGPRLAHPALVWDVAIGQSTLATHHVRANLFYRGLSFRSHPALGDTLRSRAEVVGLRQTSARPGRAAVGLVALRVTTVGAAGRPVLDFVRCAMIPLRDPQARTGRCDDLDAAVAAALNSDGARADKPPAWDLGALRARVRRSEVAPGDRINVVGGDVVSGAAELARLTLNIAQVHHDAAAAGGRRLVYGGHTIGIALAQTSRALPDIATVLAWQSCHHTGPVHEGDTLSSVVEVVDLRPLPDPAGRVVDLRTRVSARSDDPAAETRAVLDWSFSVLMP